MRKERIKEGKESEQLASVRNFFEGHAIEYQQKYQKKDVFYDYFFFERLRKATQNINFKGKSILDVGAGTGPLYDYLLSNGNDNFSKYIATDISEGMLKQSSVPIENQLVGDFLNFKFEDKFDLVFMLGVSTYLKEDQMTKYLFKIKKNLKKDGILIITFTNNHSLDITIRKLTKPIVKLFAGKNRVLSQSFNSTYYSKKQCENLVKGTLDLVNTKGLNHTFFPISRILPGISVNIAKAISKLKEGIIKHFLSSDLLVIAKKDD